MYKHSPNRIQRSTGFKVKQVLQICVLVAVCFWLIYQVKHFHDKKKLLEENDTITSLDTDSHGMKIGGRKDLLDPLKEKPLTTEKKDEETEEEIGVEEIDDKHEENEEEGDNKHEEEEQEQEEDDKNEKNEDEVDVLDEERDKDDLNENEEEEKGDKDGPHEDTSQVEDHDHEAREEQYKGDDASSAVTHDAETERVILENHVDKTDKDEYEILSSNQDEIQILSTTEKTNNQEDDDLAIKSGKAKQHADSNPLDTENLETDVSENQKTEEDIEENENEIMELEKETDESEFGEGHLGHHELFDDSDSSISLEKDARKRL